MSKSKSKMIKVPKRVAGVKIPKAVRKGPVLEFVNSKAGRLLLAEAITAALGAVAYKQDKSGENFKEALGDAQDGLKHGASRLTHAFAVGVRAFREALNEEPAEDARHEERAADSAPEDEDIPLAPKKSFRRSSQPTSSAG